MNQLTPREFDVMAPLILGGLLQLAGERTPQSLYYVLVGRKANQTIQDVHHYRLHPYYRLFPGFLKERWQEFVTYFLQSGWMERKKAGDKVRQLTFAITEAGRQQVQRGNERYRLDYWLSPLNGIVYGERLELFWMRLHLLVQTISHLKRRQHAFYPVVQRKQVQAWVKQHLTRPLMRHRLENDQLYNELLEVLSPYDKDMQRLLVDQLSGATQVGHTLEQISVRSGEPLPLVQLKMKWLLTRLLCEVVEAGVQRYPVLSALAAVESARDPRLSASAGETYRLLKKGLGIEEIMNRRRLKRGTVEDHLVEIALHCPEWDISPYLPEEVKQLILHTSRKAGTKRLRIIKDMLGEQCSYLQIRLALAQEGGMMHAEAAGPTG